MQAREFILLGSDKITAPELAAILQGHKEWADVPAELKLRDPKRRMRDPASSSLLIAVLTSGATSALLAGILKIIEARKSPERKIVIKSSAGATIEVPADCSSERLQELAALVDRLEKPRIIIPT
jgi:hypothetical protein